MYKYNLSGFQQYKMKIRSQLIYEFLFLKTLYPLDSYKLCKLCQPIGRNPTVQ
jgi:hypothetical protein